MTKYRFDNFLSQFKQVAIDAEIAERAVVLRRQHRIRLPDATILASALCFRALLVTRNSKDFIEADPTIRGPYMLSGP
nr:PIN domain-containing protein [Litorivivens lipolytica]